MEGASKDKEDTSPVPFHLPQLNQRQQERADINRDPSKWRFPQEAKLKWDLSPRLKDFDKKWRRAQEWPDANGPGVVTLPQVDPMKRYTESIIVLDSYTDVFKRVYNYGLAFPWTGVLITGQPGTGKTMFQRYLLVRLRQQDQIVLFSPDGHRLWLFYFDEVYTSTVNSNPQLPECMVEGGFIWSLFDMVDERHPPPLLWDSPCFPVQTASPNPEQFKIWVKQHNPLRLGLPLWTHEELARGLPYQVFYKPLLVKLRLAFQTIQVNWEAMGAFKSVREVLSLSASNSDSPLTPDAAFECLLVAAISLCGLVARNVYHAIENWRNAEQGIEGALTLATLETLHQVALSIAADEGYNERLCHRIIVQIPKIPDKLTESVRWRIDLRSKLIARRFVQKLGTLKEEDLRTWIDRFNGISGAKAIAGILLEECAHRALANGTNGNPLSLIENSGNTPVLPGRKRRRGA